MDLNSFLNLTWSRVEIQIRCPKDLNTICSKLNLACPIISIFRKKALEKGMSITLPCCHLAKRASLGNRTLAFRLLNSSIQAEVPFSRFVTRARKTTSLQIHSRSFTLPDLSKFAPFGSSGSKSNCDTYHETVDLPFSKDLLFKIVSDVNQYHQFVPYCVESKIDASSEKLINKETREFLANLAIGYGQFRESYTSKVIIIDGKSVQVRFLIVRLPSHSSDKIFFF